MLTIANLTYRIAGREILREAGFALPAGHHAGLIGRNGSGKSTLLRLIAGEIAPDSGKIETPKSWRIGRLAQDAPGDTRTPLGYVLAADSERAALLAEAERAEDPDRIAAIHARLADIAAHSAEARAAAILAGLGFNERAQQRALGEFSGGWRMRVALAAQLFAAPDLLLLDEPTNHLDLEAALWLENFLGTYPKTVLLVSHDRDLLNRAVTRILHLAGGQCTLYSGGYDDFAEARRQKLALDAATAAKQEAQRRHMMAFVDRFRYKASKARQAQSRLKAIARLKPIVAESADETLALSLSFPEPKPLAPPLITLDRVAVGYQPGRPVLSGLDLRIDPEDRIALLGVNGNGKSTFIKLLAGRLLPMAGEMRRSGKLRIGYFAQDQMEELDIAATPLQALGRIARDLTSEKARAHLARFGLGQHTVGTRIADLSGGEKSRLAFALITWDAPHILLLDEPSNHLDIDSRQSLIEALNEFSGAAILISHDPHLIELCADRLWLVAEGGIAPFTEDLDSYRRQVLAGSGIPNSRKAAPPRRRAEPVIAEGTARQRAAEQAEQAVQKLAEALGLVEAELARPELYAPAGAEALGHWQAKHAEVKRRLAAAEAAWLKAQEKLETP